MKESERKRLLDILAEAPDEILLDAVLDLKRHKQRMSEDTASAFKFFGGGAKAPPAAGSESSPGSPQRPAEPLAPPPPSPTPRLKKMTAPGVPAARIGADTEAAAVGLIRKLGPQGIGTLAIAMKRSVAAAEPLLARLCSKQVLTYWSDGTYALTE